MAPIGRKDGSTMETRTTSRTVTFNHPFFLPGMEAMQAAGSYVVDTQEERLDAHLVNGFRRVAAWMFLPCELESRGVSRMISIDAAKLAAALALDARHPIPVAP